MVIQMHSDSSAVQGRACVIVLVVVVVLSGSACTTGSGSPGHDWFRDYVATEDRVFEATLAALEDTGFYLDTVDEGKRRIRARSSARRTDLETTLLVNVQPKTDRVRVSVMAQSPGLEEGRTTAPVSGIVRDFFNNLDARLEGRVD